MDNILFNDEDYFYEVDFFKGQLYYKLKKGTIDVELIFQPEYNRARHELLNFYFVDTEAEREQFMKRRTIHEYILNFGLIVRKEFFPFLSAYLMGSIGVGYFDEGSERMAMGFAFSDNIALGASLRFLKNFHFEIRPGFRHVSNANLNYPNSGYNSLNLELGLSYDMGN